MSQNTLKVKLSVLHNSNTTLISQERQQNVSHKGFKGLTEVIHKREFKVKCLNMFRKIHIKQIQTCKPTGVTFST